MCDFSTKLIAWRDGELPDDEAAAVERHVRVCGECQNRLDAYQNVTGMLNAYCDAALASQTLGSARPNWAPVLGAAASVAVLLLIFAYKPAVRSLPDSPAAAVAAIPSIARLAAISKTAHAPASPQVRRHSVAARARIQDAQLGALPGKQANAQINASWRPAEPAIQIAIPGQAIFPPGALPEGINFVADVSIAADGSAQRLRLQPQLAVFEGGSN
jgi:anti-sigma factor RsiW